MKKIYILFVCSLFSGFLFSQTCPTLLGSMIDACNASSFEGDNEFIVLKNGTSVVKPADITINYGSSTPPSNSPTTVFSNLTGTYTSAESTYIAKLNAAITTCTNPVATSIPASGIPAGATFFVFSPKVMQVYDLSNFCSSAPLYILFDTYYNAKDGCTDTTTNTTVGAAYGTTGVGFNRCGTLKNYSSPGSNVKRYFSVTTNTCSESASIVSYDYTKLPSNNSLYDGGFVDWTTGSPIYSNNGCSIIITAISLVRFTGTVVDNAIQLNWKVYNDEYLTMIVEKSTDGINFSPINTQVTNNSGNFSLVDGTPNAGYNFYRLKLIGNGGSVRYSAIQKIKYDDNGLKLNSVSLSGLSDNLNISFFNKKTASGTALILDAVGRVCLKKNIQVSSGVNNCSLPVRALAKGVYVLQLQLGDSHVQNSFIKN